jgi:hypothetical protein
VAAETHAQLQLAYVQAKMGFVPVPLGGSELEQFARGPGPPACDALRVLGLWKREQAGRDRLITQCLTASRPYVLVGESRTPSTPE